MRMKDSQVRDCLSEAECQGLIEMAESSGLQMQGGPTTPYVKVRKAISFIHCNPGRIINPKKSTDCWCRLLGSSL